MVTPIAIAKSINLIYNNSVKNIAEAEIIIQRKKILKILDLIVNPDLS
jgi:hypothetical protein